LHNVRRIEQEAISNCGDETEFVEEGILRLLVSGSVRSVPALAASEFQLPFACDVLLGALAWMTSTSIWMTTGLRSRSIWAECHVGEKTIPAWLDVNGSNEVAKVSFNIEEVAMNPDLPKAFQARDSLPKPFAADPVELKFVENPKPQSVPEPRWTYAQKQILTSKFCVSKQLQ
jgi:hypothetical protein